MTLVNLNMQSTPKIMGMELFDDNVAYRNILCAV